MTISKRSLSIVATLLIASASAFAGDAPASFDQKSCKADYPKASLMNEESGVVSMSFLVSADGQVLESKLEKSSGFKNLDKATLKAVSACRFKAGTKDGKPDQSWARVDYAWTL